MNAYDLKISVSMFCPDCGEKIGGCEDETDEIILTEGAANLLDDELYDEMSYIDFGRTVCKKCAAELREDPNVTAKAYYDNTRGL